MGNNNPSYPPQGAAPSPGAGSSGSSSLPGSSSSSGSPTTMTGAPSPGANAGDGLNLTDPGFDPTGGQPPIDQGGTNVGIGINGRGGTQPTGIAVGEYNPGGNTGVVGDGKPGGGPNMGGMGGLGVPNQGGLTDVGFDPNQGGMALPNAGDLTGLPGGETPTMAAPMAPGQLNIPTAPSSVAEATNPQSIYGGSGSFPWGGNNQAPNRGAQPNTSQLIQSLLGQGSLGS